MILPWLKKIYSPSQETFRRQQAVQLLLKKIATPHNMLDVGCGDGRSTNYFGKLWNLHREKITGIEPQEKYKHIPDFKTVSIDIERDRFPFPDEAFDLIICNQVLEHLKIVLNPLREMSRITKRNGYLLLGIPNLASFMSRFYLLLGKDPICLSFPGPHVRGFAHRSFIRFLKSNSNFSLVAFTGSSFYPFPPDYFEPLARLLPGLACYTFYLLQKRENDPKANWPMDKFPDESITG